VNTFEAIVGLACVAGLSGMVFHAGVCSMLRMHPKWDLATKRRRRYTEAMLEVVSWWVGFGVFVLELLAYLLKWL